MWQKRLVIPGVILGLLIGVSAFRQTRHSQTPPVRPRQDVTQQAEKGKATSGDATSSETEKSQPPESTEAAMSPQGRGSDQSQSGGSTGGTPKPPIGPSQPPSQEPKPLEPQEKGTLSVFVQPWAQVWIDRKFQGETPLEVDLPVGRHRVVLVYEKQEIARNVMIKAGKTERLTHNW